MPLRRHRFFEALLAHRLAAAIAIAAATAALGVFAARVRPDFSVENFFPVHDRAKAQYDRYRAEFPYDEARAIVIVDAPDLWTPAGLARVAALERDLAQIPGVLYTEGLTTVRDIVAEEDDVVRTGPLFPRTDLPLEEIERRRAIAQGDPLFTWVLCPPTGTATTIRVTLSPETAAKDETRRRFLADARKVVGDRGVLSGLPVIRAQYNELIDRDTLWLFPLALAVILALLLAVFRSAAVAAAAIITIAFSVVWTYGAIGVFGFPLQVLTTITPIVVAIISISDTVHIVAHYRAARARGDAPRAAVVEACAETALPCLLTEITIACGFLTLLGVNILAIWQFGVATAAGMMLAWAANMTVLPLALDLLRPGALDTPASRRFERFLGWIERTIVLRPRAVLAGAAAVVALAAVFGTRVRRETYTYDDLRPESELARTISYAETVHGGLTPLAIHIEPRDRAAAGPEPMLDPAAIALMDRLATWLRAEFPEARAAKSAADYWRKAFRLVAPELAAERGGLPATRGEAAQLLAVFDDPRLTRDFLSHGRASAAVLALLPNIASARASEILSAIERRLREEEEATGYRLTATGLFSITDDIHRILVGGLATSFAVAVAVSFCVFCVVLRSWRLGLIALVPNLLPILLTFAFMGLAGIPLKPSTVVVFSITLTIADDDTIQYLARFREVFARRRDHAAAALDTMRETGLPMFVTACAVAVGFLTLLFSQFLGLAHLGALIGVSLFTAVFADMFLSPLLISRLKPKID